MRRHRDGPANYGYTYYDHAAAPRRRSHSNPNPNPNHCWTMLLHRDGKAIVVELGLVRQQQPAGAHHHRDTAAGDVVDEARAEAETRRSEAPLGAAQRVMVGRRVPDARARAARVEQRVCGQLAQHSLRLSSKPRRGNTASQGG